MIIVKCGCPVIVENCGTCKTQMEWCELHSCKCKLCNDVVCDNCCKTIDEVGTVCNTCIRNRGTKQCDMCDKYTCSIEVNICKNCGRRICSSCRQDVVCRCGYAIAHCAKCVMLYPIWVEPGCKRCTMRIREYSSYAIIIKCSYCGTYFPDYNNITDVKCSGCSRDLMICDDCKKDYIALNNHSHFLCGNMCLEKFAVDA